MTFNSSPQKTVLVIVLITSFFTPFMGSSLNIAIPTIGMNLIPAQLYWLGRSQLHFGNSSFPAALWTFCRYPRSQKSLFERNTGVFRISPVWRISFVNRLVDCFSGDSRRWLGDDLQYKLGHPHFCLSAREKGPSHGLICSNDVRRSIFGTGSWRVHQSLYGLADDLFLVAPCGLIVAAIVIAGLKQEWTGAPGEKFDAFGSVLYSSGLVFLLYGMSQVTSDEWARWLLGAESCFS